MGKIALALNFAFIGFLAVNAFASAEGRKFISDLKGWYEKEQARRQAESAKRAQEYQQQEKARLAAQKAVAESQGIEAGRRLRDPALPSRPKNPVKQPTGNPLANGHSDPPPVSSGGSGWTALLDEGDRYWKQGMSTPSPSGKKALLQKAVDCYKRALQTAPASEGPNINMRIAGAKKAMPL